MKTVLLIPAAGKRCLDPQTRQPLPPEGAELELTSYWHRRIADGDVVVGARNAPKPRRTAHSAADRGQE